jgi:L-ascorbate metabolism protein UlaG (beta-lactamase superfamily)
MGVELWKGEFMKISKFGHACLLIAEGEARILIDPGAFSKGFEDLADLDAIFITHQHQDHLVLENIKGLMEKSPGLKVYADEGSAKLLAEAGVEAQPVHDGDTLEVAGVPVAVLGRDHAIIHPKVPGIPNVGYLVADRFYYPGDSFTMPGREVEVLALPSGAPWLKVSDAADFMLAVKPKVAIPVHDAVLAMPEMNSDIYERLGKPAGIEVRVVENGGSTEV